MNTLDCGDKDNCDLFLMT